MCLQTAYVRDVVASHQSASKDGEHGWNFAGHLTEDISCLQEYCEHHSWVCEHCFLSSSASLQVSERAELIKKALATVQNNDCIYVSQLTSCFNSRFQVLSFKVSKFQSFIEKPK